MEVDEPSPKGPKTDQSGQGPTMVTMNHESGEPPSLPHGTPPPTFPHTTTSTSTSTPPPPPPPPPNTNKPPPSTDPRLPFLSPHSSFGGNLSLVPFQQTSQSVPTSSHSNISIDPSTTITALTQSPSPGNLQNSILARAYGIYQDRTRPGIVGEFPAASAHWVENIIAQRWSSLTEIEKQRFHALAQQQMVALLADPTGQKQRRRRRTKDEIEKEKQFKQQFKRKRGRPSREEVEIRKKQMEEAGLPIPEFKERRPILIKPSPTEAEGLALVQNAVVQESPVSSSLKKRGMKKKKEAGSGMQSLLGKTVEGIFDGTFDAGYFVTLKVANMDLIYRGVVFGPAKAVPINKQNDVAPGAKLFERMNLPFPDPSTPLQHNLIPNASNGHNVGVSMSPLSMPPTV